MTRWRVGVILWIAIPAFQPCRSTTTVRQSAQQHHIQPWTKQIVLSDKNFEVLITIAPSQ
jgi:hypothetical protein